MQRHRLLPSLIKSTASRVRTRGVVQFPLDGSFLQITISFRSSDLEFRESALGQRRRAARRRLIKGLFWQRADLPLVAIEITRDGHISVCSRFRRRSCSAHIRKIP